MKPTIHNTLIAIFSYNRPRELSTLLDSISALCAGMVVVVFDDRSESVEVATVAKRQSVKLVVHENTTKGRHGGLYSNMQAAFELAGAQDFEFMMAIQDDMQFVRSFDQTICEEYAAIFNSSENIFQIDPRFVRGNGSEVVKCATSPAFEWLDPYRQTYSDVGLFSVARLKSIGWRFKEGEKNNRTAAGNLGVRRVYPFSPIVMHIPFPTVFRKRKSNFFSALNDGGCTYRLLDEDACKRMDCRNPAEPPIFRKYLKLDRSRIIDRLRFALLSDKRVFR